MVDRELEQRLEEVCGPAAALAVPVVVELLEPRSVVDLGCNAGVWLRAFMELGVHDVLGVDHPAVRIQDLRIPEDRFLAADLDHPLDLGRTFDLAVCLEVAEHVQPSAADRLLDELTTLAPAVLFAAGVPGQGGDGHVNEQWGSWWARRFEARGFHRFDVLRSRLWRAPGVQWWYSQNIAVYARADHPAADRLAGAHVPLPVDVVHPELFEEARGRAPTLPELVRALPLAASRSLDHHVLSRWRSRRR